MLLYRTWSPEDLFSLVLIFSVAQTDEEERVAGRMTLLATWRHFSNRGPLDGDRYLPEIHLPGGSSDHQVGFHIGKATFSLDQKNAIICSASYRLPEYRQWTIK